MNSLFEKYDLDHKVNLFVQRYDSAVRKGGTLTNTGEFFAPKGLRNYIEAMAVFAELRFPHVYYFGRADEKRNDESRKKFDWDDFNLNFPVPPLPHLFNDSMVKEAALLRIIERGGNRAGARRGLLFAKEFGFSESIPVQYSIDYSDPYLREFLEPLISCLSPDLLCPVNYFLRTSDAYKEVHEEKLIDILSKLNARETRAKMRQGSPVLGGA